EVAQKLNSTRPTAVNLAWAISEMLEVILKINDADERIKSALNRANEIKQEDIDICYNIGKHGLKLIQQLAENKKGK
ncbi:MAG TPA: hypothetical protein PK833_04340, partial [Vicingus sp.]|nr:hypothetical protein [Vicingus sp.]